MEAPANAVVADVVVAGAGIAGLYSAWRLLQQDPSRKLHVLEILPRTGGRLETDVVDIGGVTVKTEEGGMRFTSSHHELIALLEELGLGKQAVPFPMGDDNNRFYLRGRRFTVGDARRDPAIWSRLYRLNESARGKQPADVLAGVLDAILEENGLDPDYWDPTCEDWTRFRTEYTYRGVPTCRWGIWALLADYGLTEDCLEMLYQASGLIVPYDRQINAGSAFQLLADFINPELQTLRLGFEQLPEALGASCLDAGAAIHLQTAVRGIDRLSDGRLLVTARREPGTTQSFICPTLILALPQLALRRLMPQAPMMRDSAEFLADLESVTDMPLSRINLYYEKNWWTELLKIDNGGSFTDLPLASFHCFGGPQRGASSERPASLTLYADHTRSHYWSELQRLGAPFHSAMFPANPPDTTAASTYVVLAATRQLGEMFGLRGIPAPVLTTYRRWTDPRMGDGNHQWKVGVDDREVRRRMANPFPGVYVCGETWSDDQARVNGALRSADVMLQRLAAPSAPATVPAAVVAG